MAMCQPCTITPRTAWPGRPGTTRMDWRWRPSNPTSIH